MIETHIDYKIRRVVRKANKTVVSVIFNTGYYAEIDGQQVYIRSNRFWGDTNEFQPAKTRNEFIIFYNDKLKIFADEKGLLPIPQQVEV